MSAINCSQPFCHDGVIGDGSMFVGELCPECNPKHPRYEQLKKIKEESAKPVTMGEVKELVREHRQKLDAMSYDLQEAKRCLEEGLQTIEDAKLINRILRLKDKIRESVVCKTTKAWVKLCKSTERFRARQRRFFFRFQIDRADFPEQNRIMRVVFRSTPTRLGKWLGYTEVRQGYIGMPNDWKRICNLKEEGQIPSPFIDYLDKIYRSKEALIMKGFVSASMTITKKQ